MLLPDIAAETPLMYIKKSSGPSTDPCGTPDITGRGED